MKILKVNFSSSSCHSVPCKQNKEYQIGNLESYLPSYIYVMSAVFWWNVSPCRLVRTYQYFRGKWCHSPGY
jgi:hypothetical protein